MASDAGAMEPGGQSAAAVALQKAHSLHDRQELTEALLCYQQAVAADPALLSARSGLAAVLIDLERYAEALPVLGAVIRLDPRSAEAFENLGFALRRLGRNLEAASAYLLFLDLEPNNPEAPRIRKWIGETLAQAGQSQALPLAELLERFTGPAGEGLGATPPTPSTDPTRRAPLAEPPPARHDGQKAGVAETQVRLPMPAATEAGGTEGASSPVTGAAGASRSTGEAPGPPIPSVPPRPSRRFPPQPRVSPPTRIYEVEDRSGSVAQAAVSGILPPAAAAARARRPATIDVLTTGVALPPSVDDGAVVAQASSPPGVVAQASSLPGVVAQASSPPEGNAPAHEQAGSLRHAAETVPQAPPGPSSVGEAATGRPATVVTSGPPTQGGGTAAPLTESLSWMALVERGLDLFAQNDVPSATVAFEQALAFRPGCGEAHTGMARVMMRQEHHAEAERELRAAIAADPADPAAHYLLGFVLRTLGRDADAATAYEEFLELFPQAEEAERMRQWIRLIRQRTSGVGIADVAAPPPAPPPIEEFALPSAPEGTSPQAALYRTAISKFKEDDLRGATEACQAALQADPGQHVCRRLLGRVYLRQRDYAQALEQFRGVVAATPNDPEALYFLGQALEQTGDAVEARSAYEQCLAALPAGAQAERLRAWLERQAAPAAAAPRQVRCDLCFKMFPEAEVALHEGRRTCRSCLVLIGAAPDGALAGSDAAGPGADAVQPLAPEDLAPPTRRRRGLVLSSVALSAVLALLVGAWFLTRLPESLGLRRRPPPVSNVTTPGGTVQPQPQPLPRPELEARLETEPSWEVIAGATWRFEPKIKLTEPSPGFGWKFTLKAGPPSMVLDPVTGALTWQTSAGDFWGTGAAGVPVEWEAVGSVAGPSGKPQVLARSFVIQPFRLDPGPELDAGLKPDERTVWAAGKFRGEQGQDLALGAGHYSKGRLVLHFQSPGQPLTAPMTLGGKEGLGQVVALQTVALEKKGEDGLAAAASASGRVHFFFQDERRLLVEKASFVAGPDPLALAVSDVDGCGHPEVAVLLGLERSLRVCRYEGGSRFSALRSVEVPASGSRGWVFAWSSQELGPGFLAVVPLGVPPLLFVAWKNGELGAPQATALDNLGLVVSAATVGAGPSGAAREGSPRRLVLLVNDVGKRTQVVSLEETGGHWKPVPAATLELQEMALSLGVADLNQDGLDDLVVVSRGGVRLYFGTRDGYQEGPHYPTDTPLEGSLALADVSGDGRPDVLVVTETAKVWLLRSALPGTSAVPAAAPGPGAKPAHE